MTNEAQQRHNQDASCSLEADLSANRDQDRQRQRLRHGNDVGLSLEVLYECNASAILDAVECASISSSKNDTISISDL